MDTLNPVSVEPVYVVRTKAPSDNTWRTVGYFLPKQYEEGVLVLELRHPIIEGAEVNLVPVSAKNLANYRIDDC